MAAHARLKMCLRRMKSNLMTQLIYSKSLKKSDSRKNCCNNSKLEKMSHLMTKPINWHVLPAKTRISFVICPVWSESSLCTQWVAEDPMFLDQTGRMPRLVWVFAGRKGHYVGFVRMWLKYGFTIWARSSENVLYANNKGADQPVHPRSLISAFVVRSLDSIISLVSRS